MWQLSAGAYCDPYAFFIVWNTTIHWTKNCLMSKCAHPLSVPPDRMGPVAVPETQPLQNNAVPLSARLGFTRLLINLALQ